MTLKRTLTISFLLLLFPLITTAQGANPGKIIIKSEPSGAYVTLKGEVTISGITPVAFDQILTGKYDITASIPGYENYHGSILVDPTKETNVSITLKQKTPSKAAMRSILIPGWGQRYGGEKTKGLIFTGLTIAAVAGYFVADHNFNNKYDDYKEILSRYDSLNTVSARQQLYPSLIDAHDDAYDAENIRFAALGTVAGIWALNVIDALFFFPDNQGRIVVKDIAFQPDLNPKSPGIKLSYNF